MLKHFIYALLLLIPLNTTPSAVRLKTIARLSGLQDNPLTGYGLVIGLAGSGDSRRSKDTTQAISNLLQTFGVTLSPSEINSRNTATVIVSANLPAFAHQGDKIDLNVASLGDARSLLGGTLLVTPLKAADNQTYALAQGPISIGGYKYDLYGNVIQKNHPTTGIIPGGAIIEKNIYNDMLDKGGDIHLILNHPDFTTADHIQAAINRQFGAKTAFARSAQDIEVHPSLEAKRQFIRFISQLENISIVPDNLPTVVVNERTGVVVAGANVKIEAVTISHGNLQVSISNEYQVTQPIWVQKMGPQIHTTVTPATAISVTEQNTHNVQLQQGTTVADLINALAQVHTSTRDIIAILESVQRAGALHAELIIQ